MLVGHDSRSQQLMMQGAHVQLASGPTPSHDLGVRGVGPRRGDQGVVQGVLEKSPEGQKRVIVNWRAFQRPFHVNVKDLRLVHREADAAMIEACKPKPAKELTEKQSSAEDLRVALLARLLGISTPEIERKAEIIDPALRQDLLEMIMLVAQGNERAAIDALRTFRGDRSDLDTSFPLKASDVEITTTLLALAAFKNFTTLVIELIQKGCDVDKPMLAGEGNATESSPPLLQAIKNKNYDMMNILLLAQCNVNITDHDKEGVLHTAVRGRIAEPKLKLILSFNPDLNAVNKVHQSAMFMAAAVKEYGLLKVLVEAGADPNIADDSDGDTALHQSVYMAFQNSFSQVQQLFMLALLGRLPSSGLDEPAVDEGALEAAKTIIKSGRVVMRAKNHKGLTPLDYCDDAETKAELKALMQDNDKFDPVLAPGDVVYVKVNKPKFGWGAVTDFSIGVVSQVDRFSTNLDEQDSPIVVAFPLAPTWRGMASEVERLDNVRSDVNYAIESSSNSETAYRLLDGNMRSFWESESSEGTQHWIDLDLGGDVTLKALDVYLQSPEQGQGVEKLPCELEIQAAPQGGEYTNQLKEKHFVNNTYWVTMHEIIKNPLKNVRNVRLVIKSCHNQGSQVRINQVRARFQRKGQSADECLPAFYKLEWDKCWGSQPYGEGEEVMPHLSATSPTQVQDAAEKQQDEEDRKFAERFLNKTIKSGNDVYLVETVLGAGAFGCTLSGTKLKTGREDESQEGPVKVAIKVLKKTDPASLKEAGREMMALLVLEHPRVPSFVGRPPVWVLDPSEPLGAEDVPFIAMHHVEGQDLQQLMDFGEQFSQSQVWDLLVSMVDIFKYIHNQRIVHSDVKPANIIRKTRSDDVEEYHLVDIGGAVVLSVKERHANVKAWTPLFAPPEYFLPSGANYASAWSDYFSLGITAVFLLCGSREREDNPYKPIAEKLCSTIITQRRTKQAEWFGDDPRRYAERLGRQTKHVLEEDGILEELDSKMRTTDEKKPMRSDMKAALKCLLLISETKREKEIPRSQLYVTTYVDPKPQSAAKSPSKKPTKQKIRTEPSVISESIGLGHSSLSDTGSDELIVKYGDFTKDQNVSKVCDRLTSSDSNIRRFEVKMESLTANHAKHVFGALEKNDTVKEVSLVRAGLEKKGSEVSALDFVMDCKRLCQLQHLSLKGNALKDSGVNMLVHSSNILSSSTLMVIDLSSVGMTDSSVQAIVKIVGLPNIQVMNLDDNKLTDDALRHMRDSVAASNTLKEMRLCHNCFTGKGIKKFLEYVATKSKTVETVGVSPQQQKSPKKTMKEQSKRKKIAKKASGKRAKVNKKRPQSTELNIIVDTAHQV